MKNFIQTTIVFFGFILITTLAVVIFGSHSSEASRMRPKLVLDNRSDLLFEGSFENVLLESQEESPFEKFLPN